MCADDHDLFGGQWVERHFDAVEEGECSFAACDEPAEVDGTVSERYRLVA